MNLSQTINSEQANTRYLYRYYSRTLIFGLLSIHGIVTLIFAWLAITNKQVGLWFGGFVFFTMFLYYAWIALLDTQNKFVITVSQTGIHLPIIWKRGSMVFLPFSSLTASEVIKIRKNTILKLSVGKKRYVVFESCFPQRQDFKALVRIVQKQSSLPLTGDF